MNLAACVAAGEVTTAQAAAIRTAAKALATKAALELSCARWLYRILIDGTSMVAA